jgi:Ni/Fe-hydrogenase subunit HybB-like protein
MTRSNPARKISKPVLVIFALLVLVGLASFLVQLAGEHPEKAWHAYHINFLLWSAIAQGGLLFSIVMHLVGARWSRTMQSLAESFAAFFPLSFALFILLFLGREYIFPWLHHEHGKEVWLNLPFLFSRDLLGLLLLYSLGLAYLYYALRLKLDPEQTKGPLRNFLLRGKTESEEEAAGYRKKMRVLSVFYILAYALVLSLIGFDLVMSMEPHWFSTLFGAYIFAKAFYLGLAGLMILSAIFYLGRKENSTLKSSHFHDLGKLLFAFCLVWADFFYVQLLVIWYGNISEETHYVIQRVMTLPWQPLAVTILIVGFLIPFFILLNRKVKSKPVPMIILCTVVIIALWLEHLLLLGPAWNHHVSSLPLGATDVLIFLGFFGLMAFAIAYFLRMFPEFTPGRTG